MTQEENQLLLKALCELLPYEVKVGVYMYTTKNYFTTTLKSINPTDGTFQVGSVHYNDLSRCKPYLRPMSSMTEEERNEYFSLKMQECERVALADIDRHEALSIILDWLNAHHFDHRNLIERGLALVAPEGMYEIVPTSI